jgi:hypothetical protein
MGYLIGGIPLAGFALVLAIWAIVSLDDWIRGKRGPPR